jgi:hypothetical protein
MGWEPEARCDSAESTATATELKRRLRTGQGHGYTLILRLGALSHCSPTSMVEKIDCSSLADFQAKLQDCEQRAADGRPLFIWFYGAKTKSPGISWCPDCVAAEPVVEASLAAIDGGCRLLQISCEREAYRSPDFPFRTYAPIQLTCVPTLIKWVGGQCAARLGDADSQDPAAVAQLVANS